MIPNKIKKWADVPGSSYENVIYKTGIANDNKIPGLAACVEEIQENVLSFLRGFCKDELDITEGIENFRIPVIILDDDCPKRIYGNIDDKTAVEKMLEVCDKLDEFDEDPVIHSIKTILNTGKLKASKKISIIDEIVKELIFEFGFHPFLEELLEAKSELIFSCNTLGEYIKTNTERSDYPRHIRIYYKNINTKTENKYIAQLNQTVAHEIMHAFHDHIAAEFFDSNDDESIAVKEAVADFFANMYLLGKNDRELSKEMEKTALNRHQSWIDNMYSSWPYFNAIYFMKSLDRKMGYSTELCDYRDFGSFRKMKKVLQDNSKDQIGYDVLIR